MLNLKPIDSMEIYVLMDNVSDIFSKNREGMYWNEFQYQFEVRKQEEMCGANLCRACNGLSLLIKLHIKNETITLLFDTGPDEGLAVENAKRLGVDLSKVEALILSHGHFDHFGGTLSVLKNINKKNLPIYCHPEVFLPRAFGRKQLVKVTDKLDRDEIEAAGGKVNDSREPTLLFDGFALLTGEVPRTTSYENGNPSECRFVNNEWVKSPDVIDERCLIIKIKDKGICVITGCGHTGIVNAAQHAAELIPNEKMHFIMGGFHLAGPAYADRIDPTIQDLQSIDPNHIITGHCTGRGAQMALTQTFADRHIPYGVGSVFRF